MSEPAVGSAQAAERKLHVAQRSVFRPGVELPAALRIGEQALRQRFVAMKQHGDRFAE